VTSNICLALIDGRRIEVSRGGGGVAHFDFNEVCEANFGAADYTAIAATFHTIGLSGVPRMTIERTDLMRRFITFIDVMYEHKVKVLAVAAEQPAAGGLLRTSTRPSLNRQTESAHLYVHPP